MRGIFYPLRVREIFFFFRRPSPAVSRIIILPIILKWGYLLLNPNKSNNGDIKLFSEYVVM